MFDVAIIGAGVVGALTARELTRYNLSVACLKRKTMWLAVPARRTAELFTAALTPSPERLKQGLTQRGVPLLYKAARELNVPW